MTTSDLATVAFLLAAVALLALLVSYARHDTFAGPAARAHGHDELGPLDERHHLVPRRH